MVLVVGATGQLGGLIARKLLAPGPDRLRAFRASAGQEGPGLQERQSVRVLVRSRSAWQPLEKAGAEIVFGDLTDPPTVAAACQGVDTVITTANAATRGGPDTIDTVDTQGNRTLIDAARDAQVKQLVYTSAFGVSVDSPVPLFRAKARTEAHLAGSGVPYTILAPDAFMDVWVPMVFGPSLATGGPVTIVGEGRRKHSMIAVEDVAAFALASLGNPRALNQRVPLGGPEALSWRDIVAAFERRLGRPIPVNSVAPGQPLPGLPDLVAGLMAGLETYDSIIEMKDTSRTFGVTPTSIDAFVATFLAQQT